MNGMPERCHMAKAMMFDSKQALYAFYGALPAVSVLRVGLCSSCKKWHAEIEMRGPSGGSSGTTRECNPIPAHAEEHNRRLSEMDTERFKAL